MSEANRNIPESAASFTAPKGGVYRPGIHGQGHPIEAHTPHDLIKAGVSISYDAAERMWGPEAAQEMRRADAAKIQQKGVIFSR